MKRTATMLAGVGVMAVVGVLSMAAPAAAAGPAPETQAVVSEVSDGRAVPPPPAAGQCGPYFTITTSGATATVRECRPNSTQIYVEGSVKDTASDGQCGRVYASYNKYTGTDYSNMACPKGETENFRFPTRNGTDAYIYLQEVDA